MTESTLQGIPYLAATSAATSPEPEAELSPTDKAMRENRLTFERRVEQLREDRDLSDAARARYLDQEYQNARARYEELAERKREDIRERLETTRRAAFAPPRLPDADPAASQLNFRDAIFRMRDERDAAKLERVLEEAELVGDTALAKAVLLRGYALQNEALVGAYLKSRPAERRKWDEFMAAAEEANAAESVEGRHFAGAQAPNRPREIGG